jgi:alpha-tubulin suppressor-like RCC1 family protein
MLLISNAQDVSAGRRFSLIVQSGAVLACGENLSGQLTGAEPSSLSPFQTVLSAGVARVAAGYDHSCAIMEADSLLQCWGSNAHGQLADGSTDGSLVPVASIDNVAHFSLGSNFTCIVNGQAAVLCAGKNGQGQLADGTQTDRTQFTPVVGISGAVISIECGASHACALATSGVHCWGSNDFGELGNGTIGGSGSIHPLPSVPVGLGSSDVYMIATGVHHTCALFQNNSLACFGKGTTGILLNGNVVDRGTPQVSITFSSEVQTVQLGKEQTCIKFAQRAGDIRCAGGDLNGQLGNGEPRFGSLTLKSVVGLHSDAPSQHPTTSIPTRVPTTPTLRPTKLPTRGPTQRPTFLPSHSPTRSPVRPDQTAAIASGAAVASAFGMSATTFALVVLWRRRRRAGKQFFHLLFFSYSKQDTVAEVASLYGSAQRMYPSDSLFRDADASFELSGLISHVKKSRNVVVMLSYTYPRRPFAIVELHAALRSNANILPVLVQREGMKMFDFEEVHRDIGSGEIANYMDAAGWEILKGFSIGPKELGDDLKAVMNVRAFEFSMSLAIGTTGAMAKEVSCAFVYCQSLTSFFTTMDIFR